MAEYQKMYYILCAAASKALDALEANDVDGTRQLLQGALDEAEERYIDTAEETQDK